MTYKNEWSSLFSNPRVPVFLLLVSVIPNDLPSLPSPVPNFLIDNPWCEWWPHYPNKHGLWSRSVLYGTQCWEVYMGDLDFFFTTLTNVLLFLISYCKSESLHSLIPGDEYCKTECLKVECYYVFGMCKSSFTWSLKLETIKEPDRYTPYYKRVLRPVTVARFGVESQSVH